MKKAVKLLLIAFLIITILGILSCGNKSNGASPDTIKIASFNIQIFGQTKASKQEVMDILVQIIREFDIVAIQEIRDISGTAIIALKDEVNADGRAYDVLVGPRVGRTSSKEQYAYMYDTRTIEALSNSYTYDDIGDLFEREPFAAQFRVKSGTFDFVLINIHTKPGDATAEIELLVDVIAGVPSHIDEPDIICLGDFNADGSYLDENRSKTIFPSDQYNWLIDNSNDTTVAASDNTYDRIVTTLSINEDFVGTVEVYRFDQVYDFSLSTLEPDDVSDHYPIWIEFYTDKDLD